MDLEDKLGWELPILRSIARHDHKVNGTPYEQALRVAAEKYGKELGERYDTQSTRTTGFSGWYSLGNTYRNIRLSTG